MQERNHFVGKEADGLQRFLECQVAEGELPHHVVAPSRAELASEEFSDRCRRAGDSLPALGKQIEACRPGMRLRASVPAEQVGEARVPDEVARRANASAAASLDATTMKRPRPSLGNVDAGARTCRQIVR